MYDTDLVNGNPKFRINKGNRMKKILVSISAIALLMSGCAMYKKESFGNDKKYAIVSISGSNAITGIYGSHSQVNKAYLSNAQKIFDQEFLKATSFIYVPSKVVLNSKYYKSFPKKKASAGPINLNLAPGYNFISGFNLVIRFNLLFVYQNISIFCCYL